MHIWRGGRQREVLSCFRTGKWSGSIENAAVVRIDLRMRSGDAILPGFREGQQRLKPGTGSTEAPINRQSTIVSNRKYSLTVHLTVVQSRCNSVSSRKKILSQRRRRVKKSLIALPRFFTGSCYPDCRGRSGPRPSLPRNDNGNGQSFPSYRREID